MKNSFNLYALLRLVTVHLTENKTSTRCVTGSTARALADLKSIWTKLIPITLIRIYFTDNTLKTLYKNDQNIAIH